MKHVQQFWRRDGGVAITLAYALATLFCICLIFNVRYGLQFELRFLPYLTHIGFGVLAFSAIATISTALQLWIGRARNSVKDDLRYIGWLFALGLSLASVIIVGLSGLSGAWQFLFTSAARTYGTFMGLSLVVLLALVAVAARSERNRY